MILLIIIIISSSSSSSSSSCITISTDVAITSISIVVARVCYHYYC